MTVKRMISGGVLKKRNGFFARDATRRAFGAQAFALTLPPKEIFGVSGAHIRDSVVSRDHTADAHGPQTLAKSRRFSTTENHNNTVISII